MTSNPSTPLAALKRLIRVALAGSASATLLAACAGSPLPSLAGADAGLMTAPEAAETRPEPTAKGSIEHWARAYAKNPRSAEAALNYARRLRALGDKQQALVVLRQAAFLHAGHRAILSEFGRLALELEQVELAQKLLEEADDPATAADWRTISARGTVLAKQGKYREAIPHYERALALAPNQPSILNNLALALAMEGKAEQAEGLLKQAAAHGGHEARVNHNLALVLSLQGKYEEAKLLGSRQLAAEAVTANVDYVKRMVQLEPKPLPVVPTALKAQAGADAAGQERAPGDGADAGSDWVTRVAQVKPDA
jgi:Flp pilus assembly protein TadD